MTSQQQNEKIALVAANVIEVSLVVAALVTGWVARTATRKA